MEQIAAKVREVARQALAGGAVEKILGWEKGEFWYDASPVIITEEKEADSLIWDTFCVANLSKYLIKELKTTAKIGVFLKGCDSRAFNQLVKDHRIDPDKVVVYGLPCPGMIDAAKVKKAGLQQGLLSVKRSGDKLTFVTAAGEKQVFSRDFDYDKCLACRQPNPVVYQQLLGDEVIREVPAAEPFADVSELENLSADERYAYWSKQFAKCLRCNACRNICPACSCEQCIFDNAAAGVAGKAFVDSEEQFFHIIRAYHVAGRCVDCGECSRVCPAGIPLQKLNHKIIKDINELYGKYEAGNDATSKSPLVTYQMDDADPFDGHTHKGGN